MKHVLYERDEITVKCDRGWTDVEIGWGLDNGAILVVPNGEVVEFKEYSHRSEKFGTEYITALWQPEDGRFVDVEITLKLGPGGAEFEHDHEQCRAEFEDGPFTDEAGRFQWED